MLAPAGFLSGLTDAGLSASLMLSASSSDWFQALPTPDVHFQGPDFQGILARFQSLDLSSIAQGLQLIINFVKGLEAPGTAIGDVLNAKLPLINQSLSQIIDVASSITDKIQAAITNPAGAIQQLNYILSNAFGLPVPAVTVTETQKGSATLPEHETVKVTADHGTFTLTFVDSSGHPQTTSPLDYNISAADLQIALNKLTGVDVAVTQTLVTDPFTIVFNHNGARTPFSADPTSLARGPPLLAYDNGVITFTFDLGTSVQLNRPFNLDLSSLLGDQLGPFASIANALIGLGGSGTLTLNASAQLHVSLGLDLSSALMVTTTTPGSTGVSEVETVKINATGGTFKLSYQAPTDPPANPHATLATATGGSLSASTEYFYVVTAVTGDGETAVSSEVHATTDTTHKTISLTWDAVSGATSYKVYRGTTTGVEDHFFTATTTSFTDNGASAGTAGTSAADAKTTQTTTAINWNAPATGTGSVQEALEHLTGLSGKVNVAFDSGTSTYTITFDSSLGNVTQLMGDGSALTGTTHSFYINTGPSDTATHLDLTASAAGQNLNFHAMLGPFGLFVKDGSASLGGTIRLNLTDGSTRHDSKLNLVAFGDGAVTSDLTHITDFIGAASICMNPQGSGTPTCDNSNFSLAHADLPLFIGTSSFQIPLNDPLLEDPPAYSNHLIVNVGFNLGGITGDNSDPVFAFTAGDGNPGDATEMPWANFSPQPPDLFALLADPSVIVDGLDSILQTFQNVLQGQIFGVKLPLLGDLLADNPVSDAIQSIRTNLLQPLANLLRENNVGLDGLVGLIQSKLFDVLGPSGLDILLPFDGSGTNEDSHASDIHVALMKDHRNDSCAFGDTNCTDVNIFNASEIEFDVHLGKTFVYTAPTIDLDLGIPALGLQARFTPQITLNFGLNFGFGVDTDTGFYFVTDGGTPGTSASAIADDKELTVGALITLSSVDCPSGTVDRASVNGNLLFLALHLTDGTDVNGDGSVSVACSGGGPDTNIDAQTMEISSVHFGGSVDIKTPDGSLHPGELTLSDLFGGDLSQIAQLELHGGADLRTDAVVDFSTLGPEFGQILPSISMRLLIDFGLSWDSTNGFEISSPQVVFGDISLDLGSFISQFAGPILNSIKKVLDPLAWLVGPDGFLNMRIPLISDLAGHTITGADIVEFFDPTDAPTIQAFMSFVNELYHLIDLVQQASSEGDIKLNFGDLTLVEGSGPGIPNPNEWAFYDSPLDFGFGSTNLSDSPDLGGLSVPKNLPNPTMEGAPGSATSGLLKAFDPDPAIDFPILEQPSTLINLLFGKPVTLVEITLPELTFSFTYMQEFPIIGPLVGTFEGGLGAKLDLRLGYDTQGITDFIASKNPAALLEGFFFDTHDKDGNPLPVAMLTAEVAVGAAIDLGLIKAGVEGGITATITFSWNDLNGDGKVRLDELKSNILANGGNPLAVFDIDGEIDFFLKAYVTIELYITSFTLTFEFPKITLFTFHVDFTRPSFLGNENNGTLNLAIGPSSKNRLQGDLSDTSETIHVKGSGGGDILVWSDQFGRGEDNAQEFTGVTAIVANGGAGDDFIDFSGLNDGSVTVIVHGGDGNDTIIGPGHSACTKNCDGAAADKVYAQLYGDGGNDTLVDASTQNDLLSGGAGDDTLYGDKHDFHTAVPTADFKDETSNAGVSTLHGDAGDDTVHGSSAAETIDGGSGQRQDRRRRWRGRLHRPERREPPSRSRARPGRAPST